MITPLNPMGRYSQLQTGHKPQARVTFGSTYEPQHPKLTYKKVKTITDPVLGNIQVYKFSNGMEFYGLKRDDVPLVSIGELIKTGMINEHDHENGVSHFLEHLIFKGSRHLGPGEFIRKMEDMGGQINAFTSDDETFYYTYDLPKEALREAITERAEFIQNVMVPPQELEKERTVVISEIRKYNGNPSTVMGYKAQELVWGNSPLRRTVLGPETIIANISRDAILEYYRKFYAPQNRAIIVAGDFDLKPTLEAIAEEYNAPFSEINAARNPKKLKPLYGPTQREQVLERNVQMAQIAVVFDGPKGTKTSPKDRAALDLIARILAGGNSSRLHQQLVEDQKVALGIGAGFSTTRTRSLFQMQAAATPDQLETIRKAIETQLDVVAADGVTEAELAKAKKQVRGEVAKDTEVLRDLAAQLAQRIVRQDLGNSFGNLLPHAQAVTNADIQRVARQYLRPEQAYSVKLLPKAPVSTKSGEVRFGGSLTSKQQSVTLPNGAEVLMHHKPTSLRNALVLRVAGGNAAQTQPGEIGLLAEMIERGTANLNAKQLSEMLEANDIDFSVANGPNSLALAFNFDVNDTPVVHQIVRELLHAGPALDPQDLAWMKERLQQATLSGLDQRPLIYSQEMAEKTLFPGNHPYGTTSEEQLQQLPHITREDLQKAYQRLFRPQNMTITLAGAGKLDDLATEAQTWLTHVSNDGPSQKAMKPPAVPPLVADVLVTKAVKSVDEMELSEVFRSWHAPGLANKDYATLQVLNKILSGGLSTRLFQTFRAGDHGGLCYTVQSIPKTFVNNGVLHFYIGTSHANVPLVRELFQKEIDKLLNAPPTAEEIKRAKLNFKSSALSAEQKITALAAGLSSHRTFGFDSMADLMPKVDAVTPEDIQAFARKYLSKPSVTAITAPKEALLQNNLPVSPDEEAV